LNQQQEKYITFPTRWFLYRGMAYGLRQTTIRGEIELSQLTRAQLQHLDAYFEAYLDEEIPAISASVDAHEYLLERLVFWSGAIQRQSGIPVSEPFWSMEKESAAGARKRFSVALPVVKRGATESAIDWTVRMVIRALTEHADTIPHPEQRYQELDRINQSLKSFAEPGVNIPLIMAAANRLDIPVTRLDERVIILGTGCHTRWMSSTFTDHTSVFGINIANNKEYTARLLRSMGLPGAQQMRVASETEAIAAAEKLGYPVVVKPSDKERGEGVNADLRDSEEVVSAFREARQVSRNLLVEKWFEGSTHRLTVQEGQLIRVSKRVAGGVVGDGGKTIIELISSWQQDAQNHRRSRRLGKTLLSLDEEALGMLSREGMSETSIPADGQYVRLRRRDNINTGGTNEHLPLADVHPENARLAIDIARFLRLDFAGIDLIIKDITRPWSEIGALVCEVNAKPQLGASESPKIYDAVLERMMGANYRVPARLVISPAEGVDHQSLALSLLQDPDFNGISTRQGLFIEHGKATRAFRNGFEAARALLIRPEIRGAVCVMTPEELFKSGLPHNHWQDCRFMYAEQFSDSETAVMDRLKAMLAPHLQKPQSLSEV
jgi:cyanophycin synthetase